MELSATPAVSRYLILTIGLTLLAGCGEETSGPESGVVHLTVSNQTGAINPVEIVVQLDSDTIIADSFDVGFQHNFVPYEFEWSQGAHVLTVSSVQGGALLSDTISVKGENWGSIFFLYDSIQEQGKFLIIFEYEPLYFLGPRKVSD